MARVDTYTIVTDRILTKLEQGTVPWQKPWRVADELRPRNLVTWHAYRGINLLLTGMQGYSSPYWLTFKQAKDRGGHIRKGEKGTPIVYVGTFERENDAGEEETARFLKYSTVFNAEQCEGIAAPAPPTEHDTAFAPLLACEQIIAGMPQRPAIRHEGVQAYYSPARDIVTMPPKTLFAQTEGYYSTLFHELGHSTGHEDRLARKTLMDLCTFGDTNYSKEELVAEMTAAYLCGFAGIVNETVDNSAAYLASWMKRLKQDKRLLIQAASAAQAASDCILGKEA